MKKIRFLKHVRQEQGFTLVEILISLLLFSIAILALVQIPVFYSKLMSMSVEKENTTLVAIHALDYIESLGYDDTIPGLDENSSNIDALESSIDVPEGYEITSLTVDPTTSGASSRTIAITVSKTGGLGKETVTLERVVSPFASATSVE